MIPKTSNPLLRRLRLSLLFAGSALATHLSSAEVTLNSWASAPWLLSAGQSTFSGTVTDPDYQGGTQASFTFSDPITGVNVTNQASPDFSSASNSTFGLESSGFGVGGGSTGRFNRGESFIIEANHAFQLDSIRWGEYTGDESLHLMWFSNGILYSELIHCPPGSFWTIQEFDQILVDANSPLVITNVSSSSANAAGRLRVNQVNVSLIDSIGAPTVGDTHILTGWASNWGLSGGDSSFSGTINDSTHGLTGISFSQPRTGVTVSDPESPDFSTASASYFGLESTGFGVGNGTSLGRFTRGGTFVLQAGHAFQFQAIRWAEYSGDEALHLSWQSNGIPMAQTINAAPGSFYTTQEFAHVYVDANTPLTITNVSPSSASAAGRLRVNQVHLALQNDPAPGGPAIYPGAPMVLARWGIWPWHAQGLDTTISGTLTAPENGGTPTTFTFDNPRTGVNVTDPANPDASSSSASYFGFEATGFGIGHASTGRFTRGNQFTLQSGLALRFDRIRFHETSGDKWVHVSWIQQGQAQSQVFDVTGPHMDFSAVAADANTPIIFTNVSPAHSPLSGRLRFGYFVVTPLFSSEPTYETTGPDGYVTMSGVNLAGAEFGGHAFWPLHTGEWDYYHDKGLKLIRVPFKWNRIQSSLYGTVNFTQMDAVLALANARGMKVIFDMHDYGKRNGHIIGSSAVPYAAFADVWRKIAARYANNPAIYGYGLMNEPHGTNGLWPGAAQAATNAIREVDTHNWVIVAGDSWGNAQNWHVLNANLDIQDATGKLIYEAHTYFDDSHKGTYSNSYAQDNQDIYNGVVRTSAFVHWLQERGARGFMGEYGIPRNEPQWAPHLDLFLGYIFPNGLSGTYWAGGMHWNANDQLNCSPSNNYTEDAPQIAILEQHIWGD